MLDRGREEESKEVHMKALRAQLASCTLALGRWQETIFRLCPWHPDHRAFMGNRMGRVEPTTVGL